MREYGWDYRKDCVCFRQTSPIISGTVPDRPSYYRSLIGSDISDRIVPLSTTLSNVAGPNGLIYYANLAEQIRCGNRVVEGVSSGDQRRAPNPKGADPCA